MAICRFVAREAGIGGRNSLEIAMVDEIVDVLQDSIEASVRIPKENLYFSFFSFQYKAWYSPNRREELVKLTGQTFQTTLVCDTQVKLCT